MHLNLFDEAYFKGLITREGCLSHMWGAWPVCLTNSDVTRYLEDVLLKYLDSTTFLGITIDKNLNRNKQIEMLSTHL